MFIRQSRPIVHDFDVPGIAIKTVSFPSSQFPNDAKAFKMVKAFVDRSRRNGRFFKSQPAEALGRSSSAR